MHDIYSLDIRKILFLDIETVSYEKSYSQLSEEKAALWNIKVKHLHSSNNDHPEKMYNRAGIYAEFGKIVCISIGMLTKVNGIDTFKLKSFYGSDERVILEDFADVIGKMIADNLLLCAHNGKEFDFPYIARRMIVNGMKIPPLLDVRFRKPWEVPFLDTMDMWRFGDYKSYTSLKLLTNTLGIPSPKDDIDGSMVGKVYWEDGDIKRIAEYCEKDVVAIFQLFKRYRAEELFNTDNILFSIER